MLNIYFLWFGGGLAFALSLFSGYVFFNLSTATVIVTINTMLYIKNKKLEK